MDDVRPRDIFWVFEVEPNPHVPPSPPKEEQKESEPSDTGAVIQETPSAAAAESFVPPALAHLPASIIAQATKLYPCLICKRQHQTTYLILHKNCDEDGLVCFDCITSILMPRKNDQVEVAKCPACQELSPDDEWPVLFDHITSMRAVEGILGPAAKKPPVPPRPTLPLRMYNVGVVHLKRNCAYQSVEAIGVPFVLAFPNKGVTQRVVFDAITSYLNARSLLQDVPPIENPFDADAPPEAPFEIHQVTSDNKCYKCSRDSIYNFTYCTGCHPISATSDEPVTIEYGLCLVIDVAGCDCSSQTPHLASIGRTCAH